MRFVTTANAQEHDGANALAQSDSHGADAVHTETGHPEAGHDAAFPPMAPEFFPSQILWLAITFGVLYWVLKNTILPRLGGILEYRRDRIASDLEAAERMKSDADEAQAAYQQELTEARDRAHTIGHEARDSARSSAEAERKRLDAELDEKLGAAQTRINEVKSEALKDVSRIAEETTDAILRQIAGLEVSGEEISNAVASSRR